MKNSKVFLITKKDMVEAFYNRVIYFYIVIFLLFVPVYLGIFGSLINNLLEQNLVLEEVQVGIQSSMDYLFVTIPLTLTMLACTVFSGSSISMEKTNRSIESLLATPISTEEVWLGKSLAVALPSTAVSLLISFLVLIGINLTKISSIINCFIFPGTLSLVTGLVILPLLTFFIILMVSFIQLIIANQMIGRLVFVGLFMATYFPTALSGLGTPKGIATVYLIVTILLASATRSVKRFLTKERVVLSSKG